MFNFSSTPFIYFPRFLCLMVLFYFFEWRKGLQKDLPKNFHFTRLSFSKQVIVSYANKCETNLRKCCVAICEKYDKWMISVWFSLRQTLKCGNIHYGAANNIIPYFYLLENIKRFREMVSNWTRVPEPRQSRLRIPPNSEKVGLHMLKSIISWVLKMINWIYFGHIILRHSSIWGRTITHRVHIFNIL